MTDTTTPAPLQGLADYLRAQDVPGYSGPHYERLRRWAEAVESLCRPRQDDAQIESQIIAFAIAFADANDRGDAASETLESLPDDQDDFETAGLQQASEAADEDYNKSKAALFEAVRKLEGRERTTRMQGWEADARALLSAAPVPVLEAELLREWVERWHGSGPDAGWWIWQIGHGDKIAYVGEGEHSERLATIIVQKHNAALAARQGRTEGAITHVATIDYQMFGRISIDWKSPVPEPGTRLYAETAQLEAQAAPATQAENKTAPTGDQHD